MILHGTRLLEYDWFMQKFWREKLEKGVLRYLGPRAFKRPTLSFVCQKMPKFRKKCSNPLHGEWSNESNALKLVNLRACGLSDPFNAFKKVIAARVMRVDRVGCSICSFCLGKCWKKREFTRHLTDLQRPVVEKKVGNLTETSFLFSK